MNFFPFFLNCIPFEVNVASRFQANGREAVIVCFIGLGAIEILLPLPLCTQMSLPCSLWLPCVPSCPLCRLYPQR